jgi:protein-disulfide isomerase
VRILIGRVGVARKLAAIKNIACHDDLLSKAHRRCGAPHDPGGTMSNAVSIEKDDHVMGSPDARLVIVEYGDLQCPYTARAYPTMDKLREQLGEEMCLVYRHLPLSHLHPLAELAAEAAEAAAAQGKFWEMQAVLLDNQDEVSEESLAALATSAGLDVQRFQDDLQARRARQKVQQDAQRAQRDGVSKTPTFFFNGERFHGDSDEASLTTAVQRALQ